MAVRLHNHCGPPGLPDWLWVGQRHIDTLAASGAILADTWLGKRIVVVDKLGREFLEYEQDGQQVTVDPDRTVTVS
jgi:hypothetical protein